MTLAEINRAIQNVEPLVELVRGKGYHYYVFDNTVTNQYGDFARYAIGDRMVFEMDSVYEPYLKGQRPSLWIEDGIAFGQRVRRQFDLPEQGTE